MGEEKTQVISFRVSEETYEKMKKYADAHEESVTGVARRVVEEFALGSNPAPSSGPTPVPGPVIPSEIMELPGKFKELMTRQEEMGKYIEQVVNRMVGVLQPAFPMPPPVVWPPGPWGVFGAVRAPVDSVPTWGHEEGLEEGKDDRGV